MPNLFFFISLRAARADGSYDRQMLRYTGVELLLLDEPTNHLDLESISWLENFLFDYKGTLIVISHNRHFLNSVTTHIADIDYETIITYPGNYDAMVEAKTAVRERAEQDAKSKEKKIAQLKEFVARFAGEEVGGEHPRLEAVVDALAVHRVDESGGVPDDDDGPDLTLVVEPPQCSSCYQ